MGAPVKADRTMVGPILLAYDVKTMGEAESSQAWQDLPRHKDEDQVELDVNRSFIYYPKSMLHTFCRLVLECDGD